MRKEVDKGLEGQAPGHEGHAYAHLQYFYNHELAL